jgi:hypothetical protein
MPITLPLAMRVPFLARVDNPVLVRGRIEIPPPAGGPWGSSYGPFPRFQIFSGAFSQAFFFLTDLLTRTKRKKC